MPLVPDGGDVIVWLATDAVDATLKEESEAMASVFCWSDATDAPLMLAIEASDAILRLASIRATDATEAMDSTLWTDSACRTEFTDAMD